MTDYDYLPPQASDRDYLQVIAEVSQTINSILDLDQLLTRVSELIRTKFNIPYVHIYLKQYVPHTLAYRAGSGERAQTYHEHQIAFNLDAPQGLITLTARTGEAQLVNDVSNDPRPLPNPITGVKTGSELTLPLIFGGRIMGVLDLQSEQVNAFSKEDVTFFKTLAANVAVAVRNASLYRSEVWRTKNSEKFRETAELLSQSVSLQDFFSASLANILELLPGEAASIWLRLQDESDPERAFADKLYLLAFSAPEREGASVAQMVLSPGEVWFYPEQMPSSAIIRNPEDSADPVQETLNLPGNFSGIATPITVTGEIVGVLALHEGTPGRYGAESESICATFAGYLGSAIEKDRLDQETQAQSYYTSMMLQVAMATRSLADANSLLKTSGEFILSLIGGASVALILRDPDTNGLLLQAALGEGAFACSLEEPCSITQSDLLEGILRSGRPAAVPAAACPGDLTNKLSLSAQDTILLFPLIAHERQIGLLMHTSREAYIPREPGSILGAQRFALLEGIAQQTAVNLQNIELIEAKQAESVISNLLLQITKLFAVSKSLPEALEGITHLLLKAVNAEQIALIRFDSAKDEAILRHLTRRQDGPSLETVKRLPLSEVAKALEGLGQAGFLVFPGDLLADIGFTEPALEKQNLTSLCFPLTVPGGMQGLLIALETNRPGRSRRAD
ncbi:MAG: GAF domain-containing protein, partial [Anaerolineaceae bacterium]|nr:GAF domain-containing protein [Anaerolineaceae bacterium]